MTDRAYSMQTDDLIDQSPAFGRTQWCVVVICTLCLVLDGFDVQSIGYVAPAIIRDWGIAKSALTPVFTAGLVGMLIGSFALSTLSDRIGRRPVLIGATLFFALAMLATTFADSVTTLAIARLITGIGLGGIMPNAVALAGEYSPRRFKVTIMMFVATGFTLGAVIGGFMSVALVDLAGWRAVFISGGILPLLLVIVMWRLLPESLHFRVQRGTSPDVLQGDILRLRPDLSGKPLPVLRAPAREDGSLGSIGDLFAPVRRRGTFVLWGMNFFNLIMLYFLSSWLPTLLTGSRMPQSAAIIAGTILQIGGVVGTLSIGRIIDRLGFKPVLVAIFVVAALALLLIGQLWSPMTLYLICFVAGFCVVGGQPALNSLAATFYPTSMRSTGIGWSLGFGRFGSIIGPLLGGILLAMGWSGASILSLLAVPAVTAAILIAFMPAPQDARD